MTAQTNFLNNYPLFYEVSYTTTEFMRSIKPRVSNNKAGQLARRADKIEKEL